MECVKLLGTVATYFEERGFGFIRPDDGSKDVFVHLKAIKENAQGMRVGAPVEYEMGEDRDRRPRARKVRVLG